VIINSPGVSLVGSSFPGATVADGGAVPPDTQVAAGNGFVVEAVNDVLFVWNGGATPVFETDLVSFFQAFFSDVVSDPRIRYDAASGRWFVSAVTLESLFGTGDWRLAVSTSGDPTGTYNLYAATTNGSFPDFPKVAVTSDKVVLTGNAFSLFTQRFQGTEYLVASKSDLINGVSPAADNFFAPNQGSFTIEPANSSSSTLYMAGASSGRKGTTLTVWTITGAPPTLTVTTKNLAISTLSTPPDAAQMGSATLITTNDSRLLDGVLTTDGSKLWVTAATGCTPPGDSKTRACVRLTQVNLSAMTIAQDFTFGESGRYYYYPAIDLDSANNLVAVFNRSSSTEFVSVYASAQKAADVVNGFHIPTQVCVSSAGYNPSSSTFNRWGDYSGAHASGASVWVAGELVNSSANDDWGTCLAQVLVP